MTAIALSAATSMRAIRQVGYGGASALELKEVDAPVRASDRVLVRVHASSVNAGDWHRLRGEPFLVRASEGLRRPKSGQLGSDLAGIVEDVGVDVSDFHAGDRVFGTCAGAFAEFASARPVRLVAIPTGISFEQAAAVPVAATTALQALRDHAHVEAGHVVLVAGAGGGVGTFAVQIAKAMGATVTASSGAANTEMLRSIGADELLDSGRDDFTRQHGRWDAIIDISGTRPLAAGLRALSPSGTYVIVGGPGGRWIKPMDRMVDAIVRRRLLRQRVITFLARITLEDLQHLCDLLAAGTIKPVVDRTFPLSQVPEAIRYVEDRRARGKVVITI